MDEYKRANDWEEEGGGIVECMVVPMDDPSVEKEEEGYDGKYSNCSRSVWVRDKNLEVSVVPADDGTIVPCPPENVRVGNGNADSVLNIR